MSATCSDIVALIHTVWVSDKDGSWMVRAMRQALSEDAVSYTHLTLPTKRIV